MPLTSTKKNVKFQRAALISKSYAIFAVTCFFFLSKVEVIFSEEKAQILKLMTDVTKYLKNFFLNDSKNFIYLYVYLLVYYTW